MSADWVFIARNVCSMPEPCVGPGNPVNEVSSPEDIAFVGAQTLKITKLLEWGEIKRIEHWFHQTPSSFSSTYFAIIFVFSSLPPSLSRSLLLSKILYFSFQRAQLLGLSLLFIGPEQPLLGESQLFEPTRSLTTFSSNFLFLLGRR